MHALSLAMGIDSLQTSYRWSLPGSSLDWTDPFNDQSANWFGYPEPRHVIKEPQLALSDYAGHLGHTSITSIHQNREYHCLKLPDLCFYAQAYGYLQTPDLMESIMEDTNSRRQFDFQ